jgi:molybdenum cofactor cytidylyltransferase
MGRTKQLIPWQSAPETKPLVAAAYDSIAPACAEMVVVLGHEASAVAAALAGRRFHAVRSNPDAPLFASIHAGLTAAHALNHFANVLLQPGDHPHVAAATLSAIAAAHAQSPAQAIVPEYLGQGGHPVLIPPPVVRRLLDENCPLGLGQFWRENPQLCRRILVDDPDIQRDVDTPADLPS